MSKKQVREFLQKISPLYNHRLLMTDPVSFVHRYQNPLDQELVAFLSAEFAFGNAKSLMASIEKLLKILGSHPHRFLIENSERALEKIDHAGHRWIRGDHLIELLKLLRSVYQKEGSLERLFMKGYSPDDADIGKALGRFCGAMQRRGVSPYAPTLLRYFFPSPSTGSACKRLSMFLRWMVRPADGIDLGLWKGIPPSKLIVPLDTHIYQFARKFKATHRKTPDWKMAREITDFLKEINPHDPLKFDFPICHYGMEKGWT